ncbi:MAG: glycosyltransferase family 9 protein [Thermodesulfobacteriota bacterium]
MSWENHRVQSVLVIHQGALGDFILGLPALEGLREAFPGAPLTLLGYPRILELVDQRFYAERILSIDQRGMASFFGGGSLDPSLSQLVRRFDLVVVFGRDEEGALVRNLKQVCHGKILHIRSFPSKNETIHMTEHLLRQFSQQGLPLSGSNPRLRLKKLAQDWGRDFLENKGMTLKERAEAVVLHPGSGSKKKVWPLDRFLSLARILRDRFGSKILIILGPAEGPETEGFFEGLDAQGFIPVRGLSLLQVASVMEGCRLFIGNDSGISHLASALRIPTIALFGPTDPRIWSPRGEKVRVVKKETACSPCTRERFFQCADSECLKRIAIEDVLLEIGTLPNFCGDSS